MFQYNFNTNGAARFDDSEYGNHALLLNQAISHFNQFRLASALGKITLVFRGRETLLLDLESIPASMIRNRRYGGMKPVNIASIRGTLGRTRDFDCHFRPLDDRIRERWVSVAMARSLNVPLGPVELIQVNDLYFVKDGHHRISVAAALGESAIDAEITIWDMCCTPPREKRSVTSAALAPTL